jgi:glycerol-3-phosphate dehydrogenase
VAKIANQNFINNDLRNSRREHSMSEFIEKVALITGGNAGIGRATAIEFAKQGAKVVVSGRREKEGHEVIAEVKALGREAIFVKTDVSKESDVKAMIERTLATSAGSILLLTMPALRRRSLRSRIRPRRLTTRLWKSTSKGFGYRLSTRFRRC